jgi:hypothetical protein
MQPQSVLRGDKNVPRIFTALKALLHAGVSIFVPAGLAA